MVFKHCCYGTCNSDSSYADRPHMKDVFFKTAKEKCVRLEHRGGRPTQQFNPEKVTKFKYICSKHFVGGKGTTEEHPDPIPATSSQGEKKVVTTSQERLWDLLSPPSLNNGTGPDSWQQSYVQFLQNHGVDADMQKKAQLLQLWTTQCNPGPAAFWVLGFLLTHPEAMEAVKSEIRGLPSLQETSLQRNPLNWLQRQSTPVFDSVLSETLRLTAAIAIRREVVKDKILRMSDGKEYHLRRGDKVCLFPFVSPQKDPWIHKDPEMFKYDRFLNEDKTVKDEFYKDGKRVKYYTMPWGAGKSICVGKEFAVTALKQFVFMFLTHFDVELCSPNAELPPDNPGRVGFGIRQPDGDLRVRFRLKGSQPEM